VSGKAGGACGAGAALLPCISHLHTHPTPRPPPPPHTHTPSPSPHLQALVQREDVVDGGDGDGGGLRRRGVARLHHPLVRVLLRGVRWGAAQPVKGGPGRRGASWGAAGEGDWQHGSGSIQHNVGSASVHTHRTRHPHTPKRSAMPPHLQLRRVFLLHAVDQVLHPLLTKQAAACAALGALGLRSQRGRQTSTGMRQGGVMQHPCTWHSCPHAHPGTGPHLCVVCRQPLLVLLVQVVLNSQVQVVGGGLQPGGGGGGGQAKRGS
jgi:hypothetical protein